MTLRVAAPPRIRLVTATLGPRSSLSRANFVSAALKVILKIGIFVVFCSLLLGRADAALVRVGDLVVHADGGFTPHVLPRRAYAPIDFRGHADIATVQGGVPPALQRAVLDFDRDGRLNTAGLPTCLPSAVENASPGEARSICSKAIVGTGHVEALIAPPGQAPILASSLLTLFNGPRQGGDPTVVFHAQITVPAVQTFAVVVPIERRRAGGYGYRATAELPPIAGGYGALTHVDLKVGKRYRSGGVERSYTSARCGDGVLETHGHFNFADGTVIAGSVYKPCRVR